jgi:rhodanese-related sulfurtransferase
VTHFKALAVACLGASALSLPVSCNPSADLIPKAPAADEIEPFDPDTMQLFYTLSIDQTFSLLKNNPDTVIIDVRTADDFAEGHLTGALNFDCEFEGFRQEVETLDRDAKILVCGSGEDTKAIRSSDAALAKMKTMGFRDIYRMTGGYEGWQESGHPFVRDLPSAPAAPITAEPPK